MFEASTRCDSSISRCRSAGGSMLTDAVSAPSAA
jgi:hypothetical protein